MSIGDRIKKLRTKLKMTQTDLANKVGLSYIQVGRYETQKYLIKTFIDAFITKRKIQNLAL